MSRRPHNADVIVELRGLVKEAQEDDFTPIFGDPWYERAAAVLAKTERFEKMER